MGTDKITHKYNINVCMFIKILRFILTITTNHEKAMESLYFQSLSHI